MLTRSNPFDTAPKRLISAFSIAPVYDFNVILWHHWRTIAIHLSDRIGLTRSQESIQEYQRKNPSTHQPSQVTQPVQASTNASRFFVPRQDHPPEPSRSFGSGPPSFGSNVSMPAVMRQSIPSANPTYPSQVCVGQPAQYASSTLINESANSLPGVSVDMQQQCLFFLKQEELRNSHLREVGISIQVSER